MSQAATVPHSALTQPLRGLGPFFLGSVAAHALAFAGLVYWGHLFAVPRAPLDVPVIKASLVRQGKPRDEKLLPRKEEPLPSPASKPAPAPILPQRTVPPAAKTTPDLKPTADKRRDFLRALNQASAPASEAEGELEGSPDGTSAKAEGERYYGLLDATVRRYYDVSSVISESERQTLKARVLIRLGDRGEIRDVQLLSASGNAVFDAAVLGAVRKASPFPPPPSHLQVPLKEEGVAFSFSP